MVKIPSSKHSLTRATGAWLTTIPDRFSGTELTKTEWFNNIALRYGSRPTHLPSHCEGCSDGFTFKHALNCKKGGLVGISHDNAHDEWAHLCSLAFSNVQVMIKPTILYGNDLNPGAHHSVLPTSPPSPNDTLGDESRDDVLMHGFWQCSKGTVFDIHICNTNARSYANTSSNKCSSTPPRRRSKNFTPLVYLVDGLTSKEAKKAKQCHACILPLKWDQAYSDTMNFMCVWMSLAVVWSNTLFLCGDQNHSLCRQAPTDGIPFASLDLLHHE
ncbi:hypothetical protein ACHAW6_003910 [Cyclotella cf. meneghiniana]